MSSTPSIYTGVWKNWNYGSTKASTLTLTAPNAAYLVAFLALFIGVVAGHFWAILCYAVFQIRSTTKPRNGQHHQQQAILRNSHAPGPALWQLLQSMWFWRSQKGLRVTLIALPAVVLVILNMGLFGAAGILSARVTSKNSEVLLAVKGCGFWNNPATADINADRSTVETRTAYFANLVEDFGTASTMATTCTTNSSIASNCVSYAPETVPFITTTNNSCPFASKMCVGDKVVRFDSGLMDSAKHLGINSPKKDRVNYRRVIECAPITREGYMEDWHSLGGAMLNSPGQADGNVIPTQENEAYLEFFYGPNYWVGLNSTFIHSNASASYTLWGTELFSLQGVQSILHFPPASHFTPIDELNRTDADVNLLFLGQKQLRYIAPVNDPWFEARKPRTHQVKAEFDVLQNVTTYYAEWPMSVVGCTSQYQWCDPENRTACTDLSGIQPVFAQAKKLFKNPRQRVILDRMTQVAGSVGDMSRLASALTGSVLSVNKFGTSELSALPDDQWIKELSHMYATLLTVMQIRNYRYTGGYETQLSITPALTPPLDNETWMCDNQMVRRGDYQSFSVLGLSIIIGIGGLIILINLTLDSIVGWYQKRYKKREFATSEWKMLETTTLQRLAYKMQGVDLLEDTSSIVPLMDRKENGSVHQVSSVQEQKPQVEQRVVVESIEEGRTSDQEQISEQGNGVVHIEDVSR